MEIHKFVKRAAVLLFAALLLFVLFLAEPTRETKKIVYTLSETEIIGSGLEWELVQTNIPAFKILFHQNNGSNSYELMISNMSPLYRHLLSQETIAKNKEQITDLTLGEEMKKLLLEENARELQEDITGEKENTGNFNKKSPQNSTDINNEPEEQKEEADQQAAVDIASIFMEKTDFIPTTEKQIEYNWDLYTESKTIREEFFAVDATTEISDERIQPQNLLKKDISLSESNGGPQILIYHTHSQESFADSIAGDENTSIVGAGKYLTKLLEEEYGFEVLHHTGEYDVETRDYAYSYALPNIEQILTEYPSIEVVIDLHRDAVAQDRKLVSLQNGKQAAQVMFFNGLSYTKKQGEIEYLENPYIDDNLAFSFQMQVLCNEYYPGLTRRIYLKGYRYNMHLCPKSLLVELGAQTNTCQEVRNTLDILAHVLSMCLRNEQ